MKAYNGIGFEIRVSDGPEFDIFAIGFHHHIGDERLFDCELKFGICLTILGVTFIIGWFKTLI